MRVNKKTNKISQERQDAIVTMLFQKIPKETIAKEIGVTDYTVHLYAKRCNLI